MEGFFGDVQEWQGHWRGMPEFNQRDLAPYQTVYVHFRSPADRQAFGELVSRNLTPKTQSFWYPPEVIGRYADKQFKTEVPTNPRYPVYVISKGRWETRLTAKHLEEANVPYKIVIEPQERRQYAAVIDPAKILTLPFSNLGQGSIPARNWVWEHAIAAGAKRHWILDDNINGFYRLAGNLKTPVACGATFKAAEDFVDRYDNVGMAGFNYFMFASRKTVVPPYYLNTRVYSCILLDNSLTHRWRGRYNEDTDLSLRILKDGLCTVLFNAFLAYKMTTMSMQGGNTEDLYRGDGRLAMAESLREQHPDVVKVAQKWGRWQHEVNYSKFKRNKLRPKVPLEALPDLDNYGMYLTRRDCRVLLIGQAPSQDGDPAKPLEGKIGNRLAGLAGLSVADYLAKTDRCNLFNAWPGKNDKGDAWDATSAARVADEMQPNLFARRVVFLGRQVAAAFGFPEIPLLTWTEAPELQAEVSVVPHPSGIVRWWNEPGNRVAAGEFLKATFAKDET